MKEYVTVEMLQEALDKLREELTSTKLTADEKPPKPKRGGVYGKKLQGRKYDLRARTDAELFRLLSEKAQAEFDGNISACLDSILWVYFDRPPLSFQVNQED